jgi:hypothetical protein
MRFARSVALICAFVSASFLTLPVAARQATPVASPTASAPLDLAAMLLTPGDVPVPGYGALNSSISTLAQMAGYSAPYLGVDPDGLERDLAVAGFRRRFNSDLGLPGDPSDADSPPATMVSSYVLEFGDAAGAEAAFALLEDERNVPTARDLPAVAALGDRVEITRDSGSADWNGTHVAFTYLDISFLTGNLYGDVTVTDYTGGEPSQDFVEQLGRTLLGRIDAVRTQNGPGLGDRVVRLAWDDAQLWKDTYYRLGGVDIPFYADEPPLSFHAEQFGAATDVYHAWGVIAGAGSFQVRLHRFASAEAAATARVQGVGTPLSYSPGYDCCVRALEGWGSFGDWSEAYAYTSQRPLLYPGGRLYGVVVAVRVGAEVAVLDLETPVEAPLAQIEALVAAQVACLTGGACPPQPVPAALSSVANPVATPAS